MSDPIYQEEKQGLVLKIYQDTDSQDSPDDWGDEGLFLVGYHRDFTVTGKEFIPEAQRERSEHKSYCTKCFQRNFTSVKETGTKCGKCGENARVDKVFYKTAYRDKIPQKLAQNIVNKGIDVDYNEPDEEAKRYIKEYHIFGLEAYIHSGVVLALSHEGNFCDRQWDVSQLGLVFVSKKEARTRDKARTLALGLIETWNDYLSGNVYGYVIEDAQGTHFDSCLGYSGDYEKYCLVEGRSALEAQIKEIGSVAQYIGA